jgi:hypothetical protein
MLVLLGAVLLVVGLLVQLAPQVPWLGRLPGDVRVERPGFRFHAPIATSIVISIVASLLLSLLARLR